VTKKDQIGILGIGAIGSVIASLLHKTTSSQLFYYNRTAKNNIKIKSENNTLNAPIHIETSIADSPDLDWLIICLKEHQYVKATHWFEKLISPKTKIAIIRNGINLKEPLLNFTSEENIVECIIDCSVQPIENGFYQQLKKPVITIPANTLATSFQKLLNTNQCEIKITLDFKTESWKKLCESASLGSILCLSGETCWIFEDEKLRALYLNILKEAMQVAIADGAKIESKFADNLLTKLSNYSKTKGSSMLTDRLKGNSIELGAKNGIISKLAKQYNIKTPISDLITILLTHTNKKFGDS
jgi:2-dehydropantoate 2-reductase